MYPYNRLAPPFSILFQTSRTFVLGKLNFGLLIFLSLCGKIFRFISALLPFKALMLIISGDRVFHPFGMEIHAKTLAGIFIIATLVFYLGNILIMGVYNGRYAYLFGENPTKKSAQKKRPKAHNPAQKPVLSTTINFYSGLMIAILLLGSLAYVYPVSMLLIIPLLIVYVTIISIKIEPVSSKKFKVGEFNSRYSFTAMVLVLLFLAGLVALNYEIGFLTALFLFVVTRQIFTNMGEITKSLFTLNMPHTYQLIRDHFNDISTVAPLPNWASFPHLHAHSQADWLEKITGEVLHDSAAVTGQRWRDTPMFSMHSFSYEVVVGETDKHLIINIFNPALSQPCKQERAFFATHADHPLTLPFLGIADRAVLSVNLFDSGDFEPIVPAKVPFVLPTIIASLWSAVPNDEHNHQTKDPLFLTNFDAEALDIIRSTDSNSEHAAAFAIIAEKLEAIKARIRALPKAYYNPDITQHTILMNTQDEIRLSSWARANVELLGCQLADLPQINDEKLETILNEVRMVRPDCEQISVHDLMLAGKVFAISRSVRSGAYAQAAKNIVELAELTQRNCV